LNQEWSGQPDSDSPMSQTGNERTAQGQPISGNDPNDEPNDQLNDPDGQWQWPNDPDRPRPRQTDPVIGEQPDPVGRSQTAQWNPASVSETQLNDRMTIIIEVLMKVTNENDSNETNENDIEGWNNGRKAMDELTDREEDQTRCGQWKDEEIDQLTMKWQAMWMKIDSQWTMNGQLTMKIDNEQTDNDNSSGQLISNEPMWTMDILMKPMNNDGQKTGQTMTDNEMTDRQWKRKVKINQWSQWMDKPDIEINVIDNQLKRQWTNDNEWDQTGDNQWQNWQPMS